MKIGTLVRFANERDGGPVRRVVSVMSDGMVEVHDMGGYFAPHLFVVADDVADIPPARQVPEFRFKETLPRDRWDSGNELRVWRGPDGTVFFEIDFGNARRVSVALPGDKVPALLSVLGQ